MKRFFTVAVLLAALLGASAAAVLGVPQNRATVAGNANPDDTSWGGSCETPLCMPFH
ncbi:hypothetical protein [Streptomyces sp. NPDC048496]|uniref:hypothetical protein n=1 Tax=Streptomyces sp. NPDC048496 TaxID=3365558 RepID=UPI003718A13B